jgi:multidrug transporter EmrE-like cation transporter
MLGALLLAVAVLSSAGASYCLKLGATAAAGRGALALALQPATLAGLAFYAASFAVYALALQRIPLSLAQPAITAGVSVLTALAAVLLLGETMSVANWCGLMLVCAGIALLSAGKL